MKYSRFCPDIECEECGRIGVTECQNADDSLTYICENCGYEWSVPAPDLRDVVQTGQA